MFVSLKMSKSPECYWYRMSSFISEILVIFDTVSYFKEPVELELCVETFKFLLG